MLCYAMLCYAMLCYAMLCYAKLCRCNDPKKQVMIEYIVIADLNDSEACAHELGKLLSGMPVMINLIPYNPTDAGQRFGFKSPSDSQMRAFQSVLSAYQGRDGRHLAVHIRWSSRRGQDAEAACGQLALKNLAKVMQAACNGQEQKNTSSTSCTSSSHEQQQQRNTPPPSSLERGVTDIEELVAGPPGPDHALMPKLRARAAGQTTGSNGRNKQVADSRMLSSSTVKRTEDRFKVGRISLSDSGVDLLSPYSWGHSSPRG
eukprot:g43672.t1